MFNLQDDQFIFNESKHKNAIRKAFESYSLTNNRDGIDKTEFKCAWLYLFGYKLSKLDLQEYFQKLGKDYYKDRVAYGEFEAKALSEVRRLDSVEEMRNAFMTLDFSCKGFLTIDDLTKQFAMVAPHIKPNRVMDIFRELDRDCDGRISYKDFEVAVQYKSDA